MGWIPILNVDDASNVEQLVDDAASITLYLNGPAGVYSPETQRTYVAYLGLDRDLYCVYYDHHAGSASTPVLVDVEQLGDPTDDHSAPSICIDPDGYLHIVWGSHDTNHRHVKSDSPHDISAWTAQDMPSAGTYPEIRVDPATGNLYVFDRAGSTHGSGFPKHEYGGYYKSTDGGSTWGSHTEWADATGAPETHADIYLEDVRVGADGKFHIVWITARGTSHDDTRRDVYYAIFDPATDTLSTVDGTALGSSINWTEHASCLAVSQNPINQANLTLSGDSKVITWNRDTVNPSGLVWWDGSAWQTLAIAHPGASFAYPVKDAWRLSTNVDPGSGVRSLYVYGAPLDFAYIEPIAELQAGSRSTGFRNATAVLDNGPAVALWQEASGNDPNSAGAGDLLSIYIVLDVDAYDFQPSADTTHDHDDTYYTEAEVDALIAAIPASGELVMQDGVTAPPVPLETEARDDWIYEG